MRPTFLAALVAASLACGAEPLPSCGAPGLARSCPCPGGAQGAQECGPGGAWTACVCADGGTLEAGVDAGRDAAPDIGPDVSADASPAADADADADAAVDGPRDATSTGSCPRGRDEECPVGGVCLGVACYQGCEDGGACGAGERCVVRMLPTGQVRVCAPE